MFKIGVSLDVSGTRSLEHRDASPRSSRRRAGTRLPLTEREIDVVRAVQGDLPLCARPFAAAASTLGMSDDALVEQLLRLRDTGRLRRIAGIIRHRAAGFTANGMAVWDVADDRIDAVGESMATYSAISHCYQRPRYDDWPYNLFTMIHARAQAECDAFVGELALRHGIERYDVLYSSTEYKKVRPVYFNTDVARWERENGITYEAAGS
jgi:DNA-binding Lrp family transcriptional regulator